MQRLLFGAVEIPVSELVLVLIMLPVFRLIHDSSRGEVIGDYHGFD